MHLPFPSRWQNPENALLYDELDNTAPRRDGLFRTHGHLVSQDQMFSFKRSLISSLKLFLKGKVLLIGGLIALFQKSVGCPVVFILDEPKALHNFPDGCKHFEDYGIHQIVRVRGIQPLLPEAPEVTPFTSWVPSKAGLHVHERNYLYLLSRVIMALSCLVRRLVCPHKNWKVHPFVHFSVRVYVRMILFLP